MGSHRGQSEVLGRPRVVPVNLNYGQEAIGVGRDVNVGGWVEMADESAQKGLTGENVSEVDVFELARNDGLVDRIVPPRDGGHFKRWAIPGLTVVPVKFC